MAIIDTLAEVGSGKKGLADNDNLEIVVDNVVRLCHEMRVHGMHGQGEDGNARTSASHCCGQELALEDISRTRAKFSYIESLVEKQQAEKLSLSDLGLESYFFCDDYRHLIDAEMALLKRAAMRDHDLVPSDMRTMFLGSGALPVSPLMIADRLEKPVSCLDMDVQANNLARHLLSRIDPDGMITLHDAIAQSYDYNDIDVVFMASLITPKRDVLAQIAKFDVRYVMVRTVDESFGMIYEPFDESMIGALGFEKRGETPACADCMHQTILLERIAA